MNKNNVNAILTLKLTVRQLCMNMGTWFCFACIQHNTNFINLIFKLTCVPFLAVCYILCNIFV